MPKSKDVTDLDHADLGDRLSLQD